MENFNEFLTSPPGLILAAVAAFLVGSTFFNVKQWEAHWKQWAIDTSKAMSKAGLIHTPKILDCLAVGDLAGAFREVKTLADVFKDPKQLAAEFATVFQSMLDQAFKDPTQAKALQQLANDAVAAFASGDPTKAESQLAADAQAVAAANPLLGPLAQHGLQLPTLHLLPQLASNPALANIAGVLNSANLGHLLPLVMAGAQAVQTSQAKAAAPAGAQPLPTATPSGTAAPPNPAASPPPAA
jgi:hypothetical protein